LNNGLVTELLYGCIMTGRLLSLLIVGLIAVYGECFSQLEFLSELQPLDIRLQMKLKGKTKLDKLNSEKKLSYTEVRDYDDYLLDKIIFNNWSENYGLKVTFEDEKNREAMLFYSRNIKGAYTNKKSNQPSLEFNYKEYGLGFDANSDKTIKFTVFYSYDDENSNRRLEHIIDEFSIRYYY
jgi:hypothetical protein